MSTPSTTVETPLHSVFSIDVIYDAIFDLLGAADRLRCRRVCRVICTALDDFHRRVYDVNRHLRRFFRDPTAFRSLQARLGALVSGSTALQFFDRSHYPGSDLDVYLSVEDVREMGRWLRDREGYRFIPNSLQDPDFENLRWTRLSAERMRAWDVEPTPVDIFHSQHYRIKAINGVYTFVKQGGGTPLEGGERKVQLISVWRSPLWAVLNFHSTCVMNVIAYDAAYSLYPRATFEERLSLCTSVISPTDQPALAKYAERGWRLVSDIFDEMTGEEGSFYPQESRWVCDRRSWVIPLDTRGLNQRPRKTRTSEEMRFDPVVCNSWRLDMVAGDPNHPLVMPPCTMASPYTLRSSILQCTYLVADLDLLQRLVRFLERQGTLEHLKVEGLPSQRRQQLWTWWDPTVKRIIEVYRRNQGIALQQAEDAAMQLD